MSAWQFFTANPSQASIHQQLPVLNTGTALYYVSNQSKNPADTEEIWIQKSSDSGTNWTNVYNGPKVAPGNSYNAVLSGSKIYIFSAQSSNGFPVKVFIFDTTIDTMLADGADGPAAEYRDIFAQTQVDGKILLGYWTYEIPGPVALAVALYDPSANTWGTPEVSAISTAGGDYGICGFVTDDATQITYVFYGSVALIGGVFRCVPVTRSGAVLSFGVDVSVGSLGAPGVGDINETTGRPYIVSATQEVVIPYLRVISASLGPGRLFLARSPLALLNFTSELVIEYPDPSPLIYTMGYEAGNEGGWSIAACVVFQGLLYIFWVDAEMKPPGGYSNILPGGQANVWYSTSTGPGVYSLPQKAFGPIGPDAFGQPYPVLINADQLGVMLPAFDPTLYYDGEEALTMFFLRLGAGTTAPRTFSLAGSARRDCPDRIAVPKLDWSTFQREMEAYRPLDVEEVRVPCAPDHPEW